MWRLKKTVLVLFVMLISRSAFAFFDPVKAKRVVRNLSAICEIGRGNCKIFLVLRGRDISPAAGARRVATKGAPPHELAFFPGGISTGEVAAGRSLEWYVSPVPEFKGLAVASEDGNDENREANDGNTNHKG